MTDKSPLFVSSMELLSHSIELYRANKPRKFKFVILHLANSIELILKDLMIDKGESIYKPKQPNQTIGIWEAFEKLSDHKVTLPERPIIELLIDDRNTIQHRFGFPDAESVFYYLQCVVAFFRRLLSDEYGIELSEVLKSYLAKDELSFVGLGESDHDNEHALDPLFEISPESAILQAFNLVEQRVIKLTVKPEDLLDHRSVMNITRNTPSLLRQLADRGYVTKEAAKQFQVFRELRNRAAHAVHFDNDKSNPDWSEALKFAKLLLDAMDRAIDDKFEPSTK